MEHLIRKGLPGIPLTHVPSPPSSIPIKLNHQYFSMSRSGLAWEAVERAHNLAAYIRTDFPNPEAELIVLLPGSERRVQQRCPIHVHYGFAGGLFREARP